MKLPIKQTVQLPVRELLRDPASLNKGGVAWILAAGFWRDAGVWRDNAVWRD